MKKILISLLMLCSITAAWAGEGNGTKEHPYTGEWDAIVLIPQLKEGDHLAYDCIIKTGSEYVSIYVFDDKINPNNTTKIIDNWMSWGVGYAISEDKPLPNDYQDYYSFNSAEARKNHTFIVTKAEYYDARTINIIGHYSGHYDRGDGTEEKPYGGEWSVYDLARELKKGDYLSQDCHLSGEIAVYDDKLGEYIFEDWQDWYVGSFIADKPFANYDDYCKKWNTAEETKNHLWVITDVSRRGLGEIVITGHFTGKYVTPEADGIYHIGTASDLKFAVQRDNSAQILLTDDIYLSDVAAGTYCDKFSGILEGDGHTIWAARPEIKHESDGRYSRGFLFLETDSATFKNLTYKNLHQEHSQSSGIITKEARGCTFENICLDNVKVKAENDNAGAFAGVALNSTFKNIVVKNSDIRADGNRAGGIVGDANWCIFEDIKIQDTKVWADNEGAAGIVANVMNSTFDNISIENGLCVAHESRIVGGIAGRSMYSNYSNCKTNDNTILYSKNGSALDTEHVPNTDQSVSFAGGIVGYSLESKINNCINSALVVFSTNYGGGITGYAIHTDISDCLSAGAVMHASTYDTFLGWIDYKNFPKKERFYKGEKYNVRLGRSQLSIKKATYGGFGGIAGGAYDTRISLCTSFGTVDGSSTGSGGLVGYLYAYNTIENCLVYDVYSIMFDNTYFFDIATRNTNKSSESHHNKIVNCFVKKNANCSDDYPTGGGYYLTLSRGIIDDPDSEVRNVFASKGYDGFEGYPEYAIKNGLVTRMLNRDQTEGKPIWRQNMYVKDGMGVDDCPTIDPTHDVVLLGDVLYNKTKISNADELKAFAKRVNEGDQFACASLTSDIKITDGSWTPIGNKAHAWRGLFYGNGHTIDGLTCSSDQPVGLFGVVGDGAEINSVIIGKNCTFTGTGIEGAGGIVGGVITGESWANVLIDYCGSFANINVQKHGGGILGRIQGDMGKQFRVYVKNSFSMGNITADDGDSGLLCGYTKNNAFVSNSWSGGQLRNGKNPGVWPYSWKNKSNEEGEFLVGYDEKVDIQNCYIVDMKSNVDRYDEHSLQTGVTNVFADRLTNGVLAFRLNGGTNDTKKTLTWQQNLGTDTIPVYGAKGVYHIRTVNKKFNTICLPYHLESNENIRYYTFTEAVTDGDEIHLKFDYADKVSAGKAALFFTDLTGNIEFKHSGEYVYGDFISSGGPTWYMNGTYQEDVFTSPKSKTIYHVTDYDVRNDNDVTISPFCAYFEGPNIDDINGKTIKIVIDGKDLITTTINSLSRESQGKTTSYSLMGTQVDNNYRGIVIQNGKKYVRK